MSAAPSSTVELTVDLGALARNFARLRAAAAPAECGAVVKANAYGLGVGPVARRLAREGCRTFFVATLAEGEELRQILPDAEILVFEGVLPGIGGAFTAAGLVPVLNSLEELREWAGRSDPVAVHIDTGMSRLGLSAADVRALAADRALLARLEIATVMTHLACADDRAHPLTRLQLERFDALRRELPPARTSIGNSAGAFRGAAYCGDLARPGIALYGGNPFVGRESPVECVATLRGRVLQVRSVEEECTVGYGATYETRPPARLAVMGVGYADGYPRCLGNRAFAAFGGTRLPVVGRVSMELLNLDVSALPPGEPAVGDWVELVCPAVTVDEVAAAADTISYEILTRFGPRLRRVYVDGDEPA